MTTKLYLYTDEQGWVLDLDGAHKSLRWGAGFLRSRKNGFPAYTDPTLATLFERAFSRGAYNLWEAETNEATHPDKFGVRVYTSELRTTREIASPGISVLKHVKWGVRCVMEVYTDNDWQEWATAWLGDNYDTPFPREARRPEAEAIVEAAKHYDRLRHAKEDEELFVRMARENYSTTPELIGKAVSNAQVTAAGSAAYNAIETSHLTAKAAVYAAESAKYMEKKIDFLGILSRS